MKSKNKRITIYDIARAAEVSRQTISRVLNNAGPIRPETRERVLRIISELEYRPDPLARGLARNRSHVVGILTNSFTGFSYGKILEGAEERASELGFQTLITRTLSSSNDASEPIDIQLLDKQRMEGLLIVYSGSNTDRFKMFEQMSSSIPIVTLGYAAGNPRVTSVHFDNMDGARIAVSHLLSQRKENVLNLCGPTQMLEVTQRIDGYKSAYKNAGLPYNPQLSIHCASWNVDAGWEAVTHCINSGIRFDSIFAQNDVLALGAIHALREAGLKVPLDIPVIGFDDIPLAAYLEPPLTTVHRPTNGLGRLSMDTLIRKIEHGDDEGIMPEAERESIAGEGLHPYLVLRKSCL